MESRTENTKRNIFFGLVYQIIHVVLPFVVRTAALYVMGAQYSGLTSLFTSILQVLNLAELGFSSAIVFNMYKPIAEGKTEEVCALLNYYRKLYYLIGLIILISGCSLLPWLPNLIDGEIPEGVNLYLLYLIYLLNTVISYWLFAYKSSLITAMQRIDLINKVHSITNILYNLLDFLVVILTQNIYLYASISILLTIVDNVSVHNISKKFFPQYSCRGSVSFATKKKIKKQVWGIMLLKIGAATRNSFDSIIISALYGLVSVTIYSNYYYIFNGIYGFLWIIADAITASVGNSVSQESVEKNYNDFNRFQFLFCGIICFCCTCLLCLYQPFMKLWVGEELMLPFFEMSLFCIYFFILNSNNVGQIYFSTNGLWWYSRVYTIIEAVANLLFNIVLGKLWGISGVLFATIITIFCFQFIPRTGVIFKEYFKKKPYMYYISTISYGVVTVVSCALAYLICINIPVDGFLCLFVRLFVCMIVSPTIYFLFLSWTNVGKDALNFMKIALKIRLH